MCGSEAQCSVCMRCIAWMFVCLYVGIGVWIVYMCSQYKIYIIACIATFGGVVSCYQKFAFHNFHCKIPIETWELQAPEEVGFIVHPNLMQKISQPVCRVCYFLGVPQNYGFMYQKLIIFGCQLGVPLKKNKLHWPMDRHQPVQHWYLML